jgi:hypothetical protein
MLPAPPEPIRTSSYSQQKSTVAMSSIIAVPLNKLTCSARNVRKSGGDSIDDGGRFAPSVFASQPIEGVSERYSFLPTCSILNGMRQNGWVPVRAQEQSIRIEARRGFQKHVVRFARAECNFPYYLASSLPRYLDMPKTKGVDWHDRPGCFLALAVGRALVGLVG